MPKATVLTKYLKEAIYKVYFEIEKNGALQNYYVD